MLLLLEESFPLEDNLEEVLVLSILRIVIKEDSCHLERRRVLRICGGRPFCAEELIVVGEGSEGALVRTVERVFILLYCFQELKHVYIEVVTNMQVINHEEDRFASILLSSVTSITIANHKGPQSLELIEASHGYSHYFACL